MRDVEKSKMYFRHKINSSPNLSIKKRKRKKKRFFFKAVHGSGIKRGKKKLPPPPKKKECLQALKIIITTPVSTR